MLSLIYRSGQLDLVAAEDGYATIYHLTPDSDGYLGVTEGPYAEESLEASPGTEVKVDEKVKEAILEVAVVLYNIELSKR